MALDAKELFLIKEVLPVRASDSLYDLVYSEYTLLFYKNNQNTFTRSIMNGFI